MSTSVLIRTPNHLGDCLMALPMISEAREAYPGCRITLLVPENLSELLEPNPAVDDIIDIPTAHVHGLLSVVKIKELLSKDKYDIGYILPPSFGAAASFKLAGVKERIGYIADGRRLLLSKPLALPEPLNDTHRSILYFDLLRRGANIELDYVRPKLFLNDADVERGAGLLADYGIKSGEDYVAIAFRAVAESRRWGTRNYIDLIKHLISSHGLKVVLIGTDDDRRTGEEIVEATGRHEVKNLAGKTSVREAAAVMSLARLFVGNDSGPAHLAAAVGIPIVVLSGADDPKSTSPMAARKGLIYREELECISCVKNKCPLKGEQQMQCMTLITLDRVTDEADRLLAE